ncbi:MAG: hypothetical protein ACK559_25040, partial [bacterium]
LVQPAGDVAAVLGRVGLALRGAAIGHLLVGAVLHPPVRAALGARGPVGRLHRVGLGLELLRAGGARIGEILMVGLLTRRAGGVARGVEVRPPVGLPVAPGAHACALA